MNFSEGVGTVDKKLFKVGQKIEDLKADATAVLEATKLKMEQDILR